MVLPGFVAAESRSPATPVRAEEQTEASRT
jgi:hypothetical protein